MSRTQIGSRLSAPRWCGPGESDRYQHALPGQLAKDAETLEAFLTGAAEGKVVPLRTGAHSGAHLARTAQPSGI
jgi:hypothetical protein